MERVLQLMDELDDVVAWLGHAWLRLAWRGAGLAGLCAIVLAAYLPL
jgi:hypothetical protein